MNTLQLQPRWHDLPAKRKAATMGHPLVWAGIAGGLYGLIAALAGLVYHRIGIIQAVANIWGQVNAPLAPLTQAAPDAAPPASISMAFIITSATLLSLVGYAFKRLIDINDSFAKAAQAQALALQAQVLVQQQQVSASELNARATQENTVAVKMLNERMQAQDRRGPPTKRD